MLLISSAVQAVQLCMDRMYDLLCCTYAHRSIPILTYMNAVRAHRFSLARNLAANCLLYFLLACPPPEQCANSPTWSILGAWARSCLSLIAQQQQQQEPPKPQEQQQQQNHHQAEQLQQQHSPPQPQEQQQQQQVRCMTLLVQQLSVSLPGLLLELPAPLAVQLLELLGPLGATAQARAFVVRADGVTALAQAAGGQLAAHGVNAWDVPEAATALYGLQAAGILLIEAFLAASMRILAKVRGEAQLGVESGEKADAAGYGVLGAHWGGVRVKLEDGEEDWQKEQQQRPKKRARYSWGRSSEPGNCGGGGIEAGRMGPGKAAAGACQEGGGAGAGVEGTGLGGEQGRGPGQGSCLSATTAAAGDRNFWAGEKCPQVADGAGASGVSPAAGGGRAHWIYSSTDLQERLQQLLGAAGICIPLCTAASSGAAGGTDSTVGSCVVTWVAAAAAAGRVAAGGAREQTAEGIIRSRFVAAEVQQLWLGCVSLACYWLSRCRHGCQDQQPQQKQQGGEEQQREQQVKQEGHTHQQQQQVQQLAEQQADALWQQIGQAVEAWVKYAPLEWLEQLGEVVCGNTASILQLDVTAAEGIHPAAGDYINAAAGHVGYSLPAVPPAAASGEMQEVWWSCSCSVLEGHLEALLAAVGMDRPEQGGGIREHQHQQAGLQQGMGFEGFGGPANAQWNAGGASEASQLWQWLLPVPFLLRVFFASLHRKRSTSLNSSSNSRSRSRSITSYPTAGSSSATMGIVGDPAARESGCYALGGAELESCDKLQVISSIGSLLVGLLSRGVVNSACRAAAAGLLRDQQVDVSLPEVNAVAVKLLEQQVLGVVLRESLQHPDVGLVIGLAAAQQWEQQQVGHRRQEQGVPNSVSEVGAGGVGELGQEQKLHQQVQWGQLEQQQHQQQKGDQHVLEVSSCQQLSGDDVWDKHQQQKEQQQEGIATEEAPIVQLAEGGDMAQIEAGRTAGRCFRPWWDPVGDAALASLASEDKQRVAAIGKEVSAKLAAQAAAAGLPEGLSVRALAGESAAGVSGSVFDVLQSARQLQPCGDKLLQPLQLQLMLCLQHQQCSLWELVAADCTDAGTPQQQQEGKQMMGNTKGAASDAASGEGDGEAGAVEEDKEDGEGREVKGGFYVACLEDEEEEENAGAKLRAVKAGEGKGGVSGSENCMSNGKGSDSFMRSEGRKGWKGLPPCVFQCQALPVGAALKLLQLVLGYVQQLLLRPGSGGSNSSSSGSHGSGCGSSTTAAAAAGVGAGVFSRARRSSSNFMGTPGGRGRAGYGTLSRAPAAAAGICDAMSNGQVSDIYAEWWRIALVKLARAAGPAAAAAGVAAAGTGFGDGELVLGTPAASAPVAERVSGTALGLMPLHAVELPGVLAYALDQIEVSLNRYQQGPQQQQSQKQQQQDQMHINNQQQQREFIAVATMALRVHKVLSELLSSCPTSAVAVAAAAVGDLTHIADADVATTGPEAALWFGLVRLSAKALDLAGKALKTALELHETMQQQQQQQQQQQEEQQGVEGLLGAQPLRVLLQPLLVAVAGGEERKTTAVAAMKIIRGEFARNAWLQALRAAQGDELNGARLVLAMQVSLAAGLQVAMDGIVHMCNADA